MEKIRHGGLESLPASSRRQPVPTGVADIGSDLTRLQVRLDNARKSLWQRDLRTTKDGARGVLSELGSRKTRPSPVLRSIEASARSLLGQALIEEDELDQAQDILTQAVATFGEVIGAVQDNPQALADYGAALHRLGRDSAAAAMLRRAVDLGDTSPYSACLLARHLLDDDKAEEARELLLPVNSAVPGDVDILSLLARAEQHLGDEDAAQYHLREAAAAALSEDDMHRALEMFEWAMELAPDDPELHVAVGNLLLLVGGSTEPALAEFDRALRVSPGHASATVGKADALRMRGDLDAALALLDSVPETVPEHVTAQAIRGEVLRLLGRNEEALAALGEVLRVAPDLHWVVGTRGQVRRALDMRAEARADLERAVRHAPDLAWAWAELSATCYELDDTTAAVLAAHEALSLDADIPLALAVLVRCDIDSGERSEESVGRLHKLVEVWPDLDWARTYLAEVLRAEGHDDAAHRLADEMIDSGSADPGVRLLHAELLLAKEDFDPDIARADLDAYLASTPADAQGLCRAGMGYRALGDHEMAAAVFTHALEHEDTPAIRRAKAADEFAMRWYADVLDTLNGLPSTMLDAEDLWRCGESARRLGGRQPLANRYFKQALEVRPDHVPALVGLLKVNLGLGKLDRAQHYASRALEAGPGDRAAMVGAARVAMVTNDHARALRLLRDARERFGDDGEVLRFLGYALTDVGRFDEAVDVLTTVNEIDPGDDTARELLGFALENVALADWQPGQRTITPAMRAALARAGEIYREGDDLYVRRGRADITFALAGPAAARPVYEDIVDTLFAERQADVDQVALLGWCYFRLGRYDEAVRTYVGALSARTESADTMYMDFDLALAICCGHGEIGRSDYERAWQLTEQVPALRRRGLLLVARNDLVQTMLSGEVGDRALLEDVAARFDEILDGLG